MLKKQCGICRKRKPLDCFTKSTFSPDGKSKQCVACAEAPPRETVQSPASKCGSKRAEFELAKELKEVYEL